MCMSATAASAELASWLWRCASAGVKYGFGPGWLEVVAVGLVGEVPGLKGSGWRSTRFERVGHAAVTGVRVLPGLPAWKAALRAQGPVTCTGQREAYAQAVSLVGCSLGTAAVHSLQRRGMPAAVLPLLPQPVSAMSHTLG